MTDTNRSIISIIVAVADNMAIGRENQMPWHLKADLKYFKTTTTGKSVVMGRRTWESLGCRPLPNRQNIIISRSLSEDTLPETTIPTSVMVAPSLERGIGAAESQEVFIMGGGEIYRQAIGIADRLYITHIHTVIDEADTFFPPIDAALWKRTDTNEMQHDEATGLRFEFAVYERR